MDAQYLLKGVPAPGTLKGLSRSSVVILVNQFCSDHPDRTLQSMVSEITGEMAADPALHVSKARVETTGSAEITGSIGSKGAISACRVIAVHDVTAPNPNLVREFRKCD